VAVSPKKKDARPRTDNWYEERAQNHERLLTNIPVGAQSISASSAEKVPSAKDPSASTTVPDLQQSDKLVTGDRGTTVIRKRRAGDVHGYAEDLNGLAVNKGSDRALKNQF
jgi:hypothetical protein